MAATFAYASHSWGNYHWARTANPFTLKIGDSVSAGWDAHLAAASGDWSQSSVFDTALIAGNGARKCKPTAGGDEVCNAKYGRNGWLGLAQIWVSGDHITQGVVKMNDTYFNTKPYNTPEWRQFVMCQEIGHTFGLDHQDENFTNANLATCMDYTNDPASNQHPNAHDYEMLEQIYAHLDGATTVSPSTSSFAGEEVDDDQKSWGKEIKRSADGRSSLFEKDLGKGKKIFTHVFWAEPRANPSRG